MIEIVPGCISDDDGDNYYNCHVVGGSSPDRPGADTRDMVTIVSMVTRSPVCLTCGHVSPTS